jgi:hypothetical protein
MVKNSVLQVISTRERHPGGPAAAADAKETLQLLIRISIGGGRFDEMNTYSAMLSIDEDRTGGSLEG